MKQLFAALLLVILLVGCVSASKQAEDVQKGLDSGDKLTVGTVQKEIRKGMSGGEVALALGSPNIVSTDENGNEVWIYDKIATDRIYSSNSGGVSALILGGGPVGDGALGGGIGGGVSKSTGASSTSQRTLTVVIKFDADKKVRDFAYHASRF